MYDLFLGFAEAGTEIFLFRRKEKCKCYHETMARDLPSWLNKVLTTALSDRNSDHFKRKSGPTYSSSGSLRQNSELFKSLII